MLWRWQCQQFAQQLTDTITTRCNENLCLQRFFYLVIAPPRLVARCFKRSQSAAKLLHRDRYAVPALPILGTCCKRQRMRLAKPDRWMRLRFWWWRTNSIPNLIELTVEGQRRFW